MTKMCSIQIVNNDSIVYARERIRRLAIALDYDLIRATRMGSIISETCRFVLSEEGVNLLISINKRKNFHGLLFKFSNIKKSKDFILGNSFFDEFSYITIEESKIEIEAFSILPNQSILFQNELLDSLKKYLQMPSKAELLSILEEKNKLLENQSIELNKAVLDSKAATDAKSNFLANMSHEIRTPMNAIIGLNSLLNNTKLNPKQDDYVKKIGNAANNLLVIINDILDFSKIEAGKLSMENIEFRLDEVLSNISDALSTKAFGKGIELVLKKSMDIPIYLKGDPLRLNQILLNLVSNAVKFTECGEVIMNIQLVDLREDSVKIKFSVEDTGIGMTDEHVENLFGAFSQADVSTTRKYGGTGLGLAISKRLIEMMNGNISVESKLGRGSVFSFDATFGIGESVEIEYEGDLESVQGLKVLVVDDNKSARELMEEYLEQFSFNTTVVSSGLDALKVLDESYQLVILDWKMPGINGIETWKRIKANLGDNAPRAILATAYDRNLVLKSAKDEGINNILIKPVSQSSLFNEILKIFGLKTFKKNNIKNTGFDILGLQAIRGAKVLLVEDNDINQQVARETLENEGFWVDIADNGLTAIEMVTKKDYAAVLMDLQMPILDGYNATKRIRALNFLDLPIIALSADAMSGTKENIISFGMNDYITKPLNPQDLFESLVRWIKPGDYELFVVDKNSEKSFLDDLIHSLKSFDVEKTLDRISGNQKLYISILKNFKNTYFGFDDNINTLISCENNIELSSVLHTLKGVAGNIGAVDIEFLVRSIEEKLPLSIDDDVSIEIKLLSEKIEIAIKEIGLIENIVVSSNTKSISRDELYLHLDELGELIQGYDVMAEEKINVVKESLIQMGYEGNYEEIENAIKSYKYDYAQVLYADLIDELDKKEGFA